MKNNLSFLSSSRSQKKEGEQFELGFSLEKNKEERKKQRKKEKRSYRLQPGRRESSASLFDFSGSSGSFLEGPRKKEKNEVFFQAEKETEGFLLEEKEGLSGGRFLTVSELTRQITRLLEGEVGKVFLKGEISNYRLQSSGHHYFTLKDQHAQIACVLFARQATALLESPLQPLTLQDGLAVQVQGKVTVYQLRGQYQLMVEWIEAQGEGALRTHFEALKRRLAAEGLFEKERKKVIPSFPQRIGVVTSAQGAALRDFLHIVHRRHPGLQVVIAPVRVQGVGAAEEIAVAIKLLQQEEEVGPLDLLVITRGGGSLEDLWAFNEEVVARALAASTLPTVSAVGHEIDVTIADFVADLRASTPSAAAELITAAALGVREKVDKGLRFLERELHYRMTLLQQRASFLEQQTFLGSVELLLAPWQQRVDDAEVFLEETVVSGIRSLRQRLEIVKGTFRYLHPADQLLSSVAKLQRLEERLHLLVRHRSELAKARLAAATASLRGLDPKAPLRRGFTVTQKAGGELVSSAAQLREGEKIITQFLDGNVISQIL